MNYARVGKEAAKMFTRFYQMLVRANPLEGSQTGKKGIEPKSKIPKPEKQTKVSPKTVVSPLETDKTSETDAKSSLDNSQKLQTVNPMPQLHINIQLHISPESTAEQIDKIFESMAKHLKDMNK